MTLPGGVLRTIRSRFLSTAGLAFLVMICAGAAHVVTARLIDVAAEQARESQARTAIYVGLQFRTVELFTSAAAPDGRDSLGVRFEDSRAAFVDLLKAADRLPQRDTRRGKAAGVIRDAAHTLLAFVDDHDRSRRSFGAAIIAGGQSFRGQIDAAHYRVALNTAFAPLIALDRALQGEIAAASRDEAEALWRTRQLATRLAWFSVISLAAGIVLMIAAALLILSRLERALRALTGGAAAVAEGDFQQGFDVGGDDELTRLADALNLMTQQLAQKQLALDAAHLGCEEEVRRRTYELAAANAELARADQRRRDFLSEVGHELRTPLTIMRGEAQLWLRSAGRDADEAAIAFGKILDHVGATTRLVDDLFVIARADGGGLSLRTETIELSQAVLRVIQDFAPLAQERGATIDFRAAGLLSVRADPDRLRQMVVILLDNATLHGGPAARVAVELRLENGFAVVAVADRGAGVPKDLREQIFLRFRRGGGSRGAGLGLTLARALASAHYGSLALSGNRRKGACFELKLPIAQAQVKT